MELDFFIIILKVALGSLAYVWVYEFTSSMHYYT